MAGTAERLPQRCRPSGHDLTARCHLGRGWRRRQTRSVGSREGRVRSAVSWTRPSASRLPRGRARPCGRFLWERRTPPLAGRTVPQSAVSGPGSRAGGSHQRGRAVAPRGECPSKRLPAVRPLLCRSLVLQSPSASWRSGDFSIYDPFNPHNTCLTFYPYCGNVYAS